MAFLTLWLMATARAQTVPVMITVQPTSQTVVELQPATFLVGAVGDPLPAYQWYQNDLPIDGATNASYFLASAPLSDQNAAFYVVASNLVTNVSYVVTSEVARLVVVADRISPTLYRLLPPFGATVRGLGEIEVDFSEPVSGVDASDLLINGIPATSVEVYPPVSYVFNFPQPATGLVEVVWSASHGITDLAASANPFTGA